MEIRKSIFALIIMGVFVIFAAKDLYNIYSLPSISFHDLISINADLFLLSGLILVLLDQDKYGKEKKLNIFCYGMLLSILIFFLDWIKTGWDSSYLLLIALYAFFYYLIPCLFDEFYYDYFKINN